MHVEAAIDVRVDVLGPLRLMVAGRPVEVPGPRRRAVLALLALDGGRVVGVNRLIDELWPEDPPANGPGAVHSHIARLRGLLGPASARLRRSGSGYQLDLAAGAVDASAVRAAAATVATALPADPATALRVARSALALWRGRALDEFDNVPGLAADAVALTELQRRLADDAVEALILLGDPSAISEASALLRVTDDLPPERRVMLLMRALAVAGRAAEALGAAGRYRRELAERTGLDPGPAFAQLEQQVAAGLPAPPAVPASPITASGTITRPAVPLFGRDHDRAEIHRLVQAHPIVTVTGAGGVGKTSLVRDVAADLAQHDEPPAPPRWIALASVTDPDRVPEAVASTLGLRIADDVDARAVAEALHGVEVLLVLDNCEHVVEACRELVTAVRARADGVRVLATSRTSLQVAGEYVVRLQPLPLPSADADGATVGRQAAVRAFVEHARRRSPGFALGDADMAAAVEVIRRLDGLPLAIELAAAQVVALPVAALRDRLARALDAWAWEQPREDARHRTLAATIDWSYQLSDPADRSMLTALAPFPAGADLATMEWLAAQVIPDVEPIPVLVRLVDASLLVHDPATGRYTLLETVRQYLLGELTRSGQLAQARRRFWAWARGAAIEIGRGLLSAAEPEYDGRLRVELPNLRAARDGAWATGDVEIPVEIVLALDEGSTWRDVHEVWSWALELADEPAALHHPARARILGSAAMAAWLFGDRERSTRLAERGLAVPGTPDYRCLSALGAGSLFRADFSGAAQLWERAAGTDPVPAGSLGVAALAAGYAGDRPRADSLLARADAADQVHPCLSHRAFLHYVRGEAAPPGRPDLAMAEYAEAIELARTCGARFVEGIATVGLAALWTVEGEAASAANGFATLLDYWLTIGNLTQLWTTARNAAQLLARHAYHRSASALLTAVDGAGDAAAAMSPESAAEIAELARTIDRHLTNADRDAVRAMTVRGPRAVIDAARADLAVLARDHVGPDPRDSAPQAG